MKPALGFVLFVQLMLGPGTGISAYAVQYLAPETFISNSFEGKPQVKTLWLKAPQQSAAKDILGHSYKALRLRYWQQQERTAWILEEIGKEQPITMGIVIDGNQVSQVQILAYRESRGGEVRHPFFMAQFAGAMLADDQILDRSIDGIAGATLSVRAVSNVTRFALALHGMVMTGG